MEMTILWVVGSLIVGFLVGRTLERSAALQRQEAAVGAEGERWAELVMSEPRLVAFHEYLNRSTNAFSAELVAAGGSYESAWAVVDRARARWRTGELYSDGINAGLPDNSPEAMLALRQLGNGFVAATNQIVEQIGKALGPAEAAKLAKAIQQQDMARTIASLARESSARGAK